MYEYIIIIGDYSYFWVCNGPFPDSRMKVAPRSKINDGMMDILTVKGNSNRRINLTRQLLNQDTGHYFNKDGELRQGLGLEYTKTDFFRFIPRSNRDLLNPQYNFSGHYSIDGERYPIEPINVKIIPSSLKVFCLNK